MKPVPKLGLKENWKQFLLLVVINAFVGGMVGMERSILPQLAEFNFGLVAKTALLSFIVVFGISKAVTNYYTGVFADKLGRKNLLIIGWIFALPIPFILMFAKNWNWVVFANLLLGINQGLTWSSTVVMKIDLVGEKQRGLAMGINESAGYLAVGIVAFLMSWLASKYGLNPYLFVVGILFSVMGLFLSIFFVHDTKHHVAIAAQKTDITKLKNVFWETTLKDHNLGSITQAGLINNLNDGMAWGIFPLILMTKGFNLSEAGIILGIYPVVWGIGQLFTGSLSDRFSKKWMLFTGMLIQAASLAFFTQLNSFDGYVLISATLGIGTAIVYPTFLSAIAEFSHPNQRAQTIGVFRLWRDLGYAVGAIITGLIVDFSSFETAVYSIAFLTLCSSFIIAIRMK